MIWKKILFAAAGIITAAAVLTVASAAQDQLQATNAGSSGFFVKEIVINGNNLVSTEQIIAKMPSVFEGGSDLSAVKQIIEKKSQGQNISAKSIQGLTQYILSLYNQKGIGGVYVYVPTESVINGELKEGRLVVNVIEAKVSNVDVKTFDSEKNATEKSYLNRDVLKWWSPVKKGMELNKKKLDELVSLLNLNPDRYVSAVVSKGSDDKSIDLTYEVYETSPWHWFVQADNSGTEDRQWNPKIGVMNTSLLGMDDTFMVVYQAPWDSDITDNYAVFGSYDIPILGPKLRLNLFGGYSQYDIAGNENINFIGNGDFYGATLRYNALQADEWFFDVTGTISHDRSKSTPSLFPEFLASDVETWMWGWGLELYKKTDMWQTAFGFNYDDSMQGGSSQDEISQARTGAEPDFQIYTFTGSHSRYFDIDKINRVSAKLRWIETSDRVVPSKMSAFGGLYTVRGYEEYEVISDGGVLASLQYEYDLVAAWQADERESALKSEKPKKPFLRKLAPLIFSDYGRAKTNDPVGTEDRYTELCSVGCGVLAELGDNFSGAVYYGYPLIETDQTDVGDGRISVSVMMKW